MKSNLSVHLSYDPLSLFLPLHFYVSLYLSTHILSFSSLSMRLTSHPHSLFYLFKFLSSSHFYSFHPLSVSHFLTHSPFLTHPFSHIYFSLHISTSLVLFLPHSFSFSISEGHIPRPPSLAPFPLHV